MTREIVLDTETTGLSARGGDRIVEIGCVELVNRFATGRTFHVYLNPERDVPEGAFAVHGLSTEFLRDKPLFADVADRFLEFVADAPLVIHNAEFDIGFIDMELERAGRAPIGIARAINTLTMARRKFPGASAKLDDLCRRFGIDNSKRTKHGALLDSELLAEVYVELIGGRQASLTLVADPGRGGAVGAGGPGGAAGGRSATAAAARRPAPLPAMITAEDAAAHAAFVATLGPEPIWKTYG